MKTLTNVEVLNILASYSPDILTTNEDKKDISIISFKIGYLEAQKEAIEYALHNDTDTVPVSPSQDLAKTLHK